MPLPLARRKAWLLSAAAVLLLGSAAWIFRAPLLRDLAEWRTVNDPLQPAEAVVVLGGGADIRPFAAARLYREGLAKQVVLMNVRTSPTEKLGLVPKHAELNRGVLLREGVPEGALLVIGQDVSSTREEALTVRDWVTSSGVKTLIIPTEFVHTRRVRWLFDKVLEGTGARVSVEAIDPLEYTQQDWWQYEEGIIGFQNEVVKYIYYRIKY